MPVSDPERWGMSAPVPGIALRDHRALLAEFERLGYSGIWPGEAAGYDAFTPLALAAAWTSSLRLATGVIPVQTRGPAVIAQTVASLCDAATGRVALGIGASSLAVAQSWNAQPYERPLARTRDLLRFLREAWTGGKVSSQYETFAVDGFQLQVPPPDPVPPVLVAALRPKMLELARTSGDGAVVNWMSADDLARVTPLVGDGKELVVRAKVILSTDWQHVRGIATRMINGYFHVAGYRASQEWLGRGPALTPMWDAWAAGDRRLATELVPDEVIDQLFLWGDHAAIRRGLRRYAERGATTTVPTFSGTTDQVLEAIRALAPGAGR
jgi:probable F420-dependent oxidoreductase